MDKEIAENHFEIVYQEYVEYKNFIKSGEDKLKERQNNFRKHAVESEKSIEELADEMFELSIEPMQETTDLKSLKDRLLYTYLALKDLIEIPKEVKEEIAEMEKHKNFFHIKNGKKEEVDVEHNKKLKEIYRDQHRENIKNLINPLT